jgi:hypothetical protein
MHNFQGTQHIHLHTHSSSTQHSHAIPWPLKTLIQQWHSSRHKGLCIGILFSNSFFLVSDQMVTVQNVDIRDARRAGPKFGLVSGVISWKAIRKCCFNRKNMRRSEEVVNYVTGIFSLLVLFSHRSIHRHAFLGKSQGVLNTNSNGNEQRTLNRLQHNQILIDCCSNVLRCLWA